MSEGWAFLIAAANGTWVEQNKGQYYIPESKGMQLDT
jgi:hypothetical protein